MNAQVLGSKQPSEAYYVSFDFDEWCGAGETVASATVVATDLADGSTVTSTVTDVTQQVLSTTFVYVWVRAGTSAHNYNIACTAVTTEANTFELDAVLPVLAIPGTPTVEPVTLTEAKLHLRLATTVALAETYTTEDDLLTDMLAAAREQVERYLDRSLITQSRTLYLAAWPAGRYITLPYPPLKSVTGVYYWIDDAVAESTLAAADYSVDTYVEPGRIVLDDDASWPTDTLRAMTPIRVVYTAGYGVATDIPAPVRAAIKLILTDLYEHRGEVVVGVSVDRIPAVERLLATYRMWSHL